MTTERGTDGPEGQDPADEIARLRRALDRERQARRAAEDIAEASTARLYAALSRLEQDHEAMRDLAAAATHDIKNPLTSIIGFVELLQTSDLEEVTRAEVRERLAVASRYTHDLIDGLLAVLQAGVHRDPAVAVDLTEVLEDVHADLHARHPLARLQYDVPQQILGHRVDVRRLFDNLCENAARYAGRPDVTIEVETIAVTDGAVEICVGDDGGGVQPDDRERIFGIFQRGRDQPRRSGAGVGLAVAQRIARTGGGDLRLDSEPAPGGGAAFVVRLPLAP